MTKEEYQATSGIQLLDFTAGLSQPVRESLTRAVWCHRLEVEAIFIIAWLLEQVSRRGDAYGR